MNSGELLTLLQKLDAGVYNDIPVEWREAYGALKPVHQANGKYQWYDNSQRERGCSVCGTDIWVFHHVWVYEKRKIYSSYDGGDKRLIGIVRVCPNCHYRIHTSSPFYL